MIGSAKPKKQSPRPSDRTCFLIQIITVTEECIMKTTMLAGALGVVFLSGIAFAQPEQNVSPRRHPNIAAAQRLSAQAYDRLTAAQQANEFDMGGHAKHAKELLEQANAEMKMAAETANHH
jgi:hypothetical protein